MTTAANLQLLRDAVNGSLDAEDAKRYLELLEALRQAEPESESYEDLEAEVEVQVTVLKAHATHLSELIDELDEALTAPDT